MASVLGALFLKLYRASTAERGGPAGRAERGGTTVLVHWEPQLGLRLVPGRASLCGHLPTRFTHSQVQGHLVQSQVCTSVTAVWSRDMVLTLRKPAP